MPLDNETRELAKDLLSFMKDKFGFDQMPHVKFVFDKKNAENPLGYTGHYSNESGEIVIYCEGRHPKDILRSLAHEVTHHVQNHEGAFKDRDMSDTSDPNYLVKNDFLKGIEADAFERGNVTFREWEASKKEDKQMNERKLSDKEITKSHAQGKKLVKKGVPKNVAYGVATNQVKKGQIKEAVEHEELTPEMAHKLAQKVYRFEIRGEDPETDSQYSQFIDRITDKYGNDAAMGVIEMGQEMAAGDDWGAASDDMDYAQGMGKYAENPGREAPLGLDDEPEPQETPDPTAGHYKGPGLNVSGEDDDFDDHAAARSERYDDWSREIEEGKKVSINESIKNSHTYVESDRALANAYQTRDEKVYNQLLKKFGIKK
jgi:flagellar hook-associated protein FlgK